MEKRLVKIEDHLLKRFIYIVMFAFLFLPITACHKHDKLDNRTLYLHLSADPSTLNPIVTNDGNESAINAHLYESLLARDKDSLEFIPSLAERWTISPDHLRFRFYLRKDVLWHNGKPLTADDVVFSYKIIMHPQVADQFLKVYYADIKDVIKIDDYTVEFIYRDENYLALGFCGSMPILPKSVFYVDEKNIKKGELHPFNSHPNNRFPIGTGPYKFEKWDTGKAVVLVRNDNYYGKKPAIEKVVFRIINEQTVALQMLKKGEIDIMGLRPIQWARQTNSEKFNSQFSKLEYYLPRFSYIGWNAEKLYFSDKEVRKALTMLINREAILDKLFYGLGKQVTSPLYINSAEYNKNVAIIPYNPSEAKKILAERGWIDHDNDGVIDRNGVPFKFVFSIVNSSEEALRLATVIKEDFAKAGIVVTIDRFEWSIYLQKINERKFDAVSLSWSLGYDPDLYQLWHSSQIKGGDNFVGFKNAEADKIIVNVRSEFNRNKRLEMFHRFHEIVYDEQPYTFLFCTPSLQVVSKRFKNVIVHNAGLDYTEWEL